MGASRVETIMRKILIVLLTGSLSLLALMGLPGGAQADVPPPDTWACRDVNEGAACDPDDQRPLAGADAGSKRGTCRKATCSKLDYASWNKDASASPPTLMYECLKCMVGDNDGGAAVDAASADAAATGGAGGAGNGGSGGAGGAAGSGGGSGGATGGAAGSPAKSDGSGCSLGGARSFGPWALAGSFGALMLFTRRRRRS
jgi:hypothetical protein